MTFSSFSLGELVLSVALAGAIGLILGLAIAHDLTCQRLEDLEEDVRQGRVLIRDSPYKMLDPVFFGVKWTRRQFCETHGGAL